MRNKTLAKGDYIIAVKQANAFMQLAENCQNDFLTEHFYSIPILLSFASEVFIKAIMIYDSDNDEFLKGHDLQELFNNLSNERQRAIKGEFEKSTSRSLEAFLSENKDTFELWRYPFENEVKSNVSELCFFANSLQTVVNNLPNKGE